jgi:hypothetical protein
MGRTVMIQMKTAACSGTMVIGLLLLSVTSDQWPVELRGCGCSTCMPCGHPKASAPSPYRQQPTSIPYLDFNPETVRSRPEAYVPQPYSPKSYVSQGYQPYTPEAYVPRPYLVLPSVLQVHIFN